jgi:hypothetical protein
MKGHSIVSLPCLKKDMLMTLARETEKNKKERLPWAHGKEA